MCVVMLIGVLDGRFRYSDEANTDLGGIPLLGILPNLPDLLTDPTQAATAAHCVHQIRTILQITGHSSERRVFTVTSASPGDGKTSLTLALGLSFAASGSRTLLVDGDLIGGGLTARLNVNAEHGVLEAMAARDISTFIRTTDVADLSFLPVGKAMGGYTGTISPAAVRRLVDEARKQFDVILIDTGPILGSIEASPVAVACDGVVLCVSRGQQRHARRPRPGPPACHRRYPGRRGLQPRSSTRLRAIDKSPRPRLSPRRHGRPAQRGDRTRGPRGGLLGSLRGFGA